MAFPFSPVKGATLGVVLLVAACGGRPPGDKADAGADSDGAVKSDAGPDGSTYTIAPHSSEQVPFHGGPVFASPILVTITYQDFDATGTVQAAAASLVKSDWLTTVGADYGVGTGQNVNEVIQGNAPSSITDAQIESLLASALANNALPGNVDTTTETDDPYIYEIYFPSTTAISYGGLALCDFSGGGYHYQATVDGVAFAYAVVQHCSSSSNSEDYDLEVNASHEFIEAATDPYPFNPGYRITDVTDPWGQLGGEVADLCAYALPARQGSYTATTVWSNSAAAAGGSPCLPSGSPYFTVSPSPATLQPIAAGETVTFQLAGWSTQALPDWSLYTGLIALQSGTALMPSLSLSSSSMNNGITATLNVTAPADAAAGSGTLVFIGSYFPANPDDGVIGALVGVYVQ